MGLIQIIQGEVFGKAQEMNFRITQFSKMGILFGHYGHINMYL
jgi:hypothetical protein